MKLLRMPKAVVLIEPNSRIENRFRGKSLQVKVKRSCFFDDKKLFLRAMIFVRKYKEIEKLLLKSRPVRVETNVMTGTEGNIGPRTRSKSVCKESNGEQVSRNNSRRSEIVNVNTRSRRQVLGETVGNTTIGNTTVGNKTVKNKAVGNKVVNKKAVRNEAVSNKAVSNKSVSNKSVSNKAVGNKAVGNKTVSNKTVSDKAVSNKAVSDKVDSNKTVSDKAVSNKTVSKKTVGSKRVNKRVENKTVGNETFDGNKSAVDDVVSVRRVSNRSKSLLKRARTKLSSEETFVSDSESFPISSNESTNDKKTAVTKSIKVTKPENSSSSLDGLPKRKVGRPKSPVKKQKTLPAPEDETNGLTDVEKSVTNLRSLRSSDKKIVGSTNIRVQSTKLGTKIISKPTDEINENKMQRVSVRLRNLSAICQSDTSLTLSKKNDKNLKKNHTNLKDVKKDKNLVENDKNLVETDKNLVETDTNLVETDTNLVESDKNLVESDKNLVETDTNLVETDKNLVETDKNLVGNDKNTIGSARRKKENRRGRHLRKVQTDLNKINENGKEIKKNCKASSGVLRKSSRTRESLKTTKETAKGSRMTKGPRKVNEDTIDVRDEVTGHKQEQTSSNEEQTSKKKEETSKKQEQTSKKQEQTSKKQEQASSNEGQTSKKQEQISKKKEQTSKKQEQTSTNEAQTSSKEEQTSNKEEQTSKKQEETSKKQEQISKKQEQTSKKQGQASSNEEQTSKKQEQTSNNVEQNTNVTITRNKRQLSRNKINSEGNRRNTVQSKTNAEEKLTKLDKNKTKKTNLKSKVKLNGSPLKQTFKSLRTRNDCKYAEQSLNETVKKFIRKDLVEPIYRLPVKLPTDNKKNDIFEFDFVAEKKLENAERRRKRNENSSDSENEYDKDIQAEYKIIKKLETEVEKGRKRQKKIVAKQTTAQTKRKKKTGGVAKTMAKICDVAQDKDLREVGHAAHAIGDAAHAIENDAHEVGNDAHVVGNDAHEVEDGAHEIGDDAHAIGDESHEVGDDAQEVGHVRDGIDNYFGFNEQQNLESEASGRARINEIQIQSNILFITRNFEKNSRGSAKKQSEEITNVKIQSSEVFKPKLPRFYKPNANSTMIDSSPWRTNLSVNPRSLYLSTKKSCLPVYDQELVINSSVAEESLNLTEQINPVLTAHVSTPVKHLETNEPIGVITKKKPEPVQTSILAFVNRNVSDENERTNCSLFDEHKLSPIKRNILKESNVIQSQTSSQFGDSCFGFGRKSDKENQTERAHKPVRFNVCEIKKVFGEQNKIEQTEQIELAEQVERVERAEQVERVEQAGRVEQVERVGRVEQVERVEQMDQVETIESKDERSESRIDGTDVEGRVFGLFDDLVEPTSKRPTRLSYTNKRAKRNYRLQSNSDESEPESPAKMRKKRTKDTRTKKEDLELEKWAAAFNSMCDDIDKHRLEIE